MTHKWLTGNIFLQERKEIRLKNVNKDDHESLNKFSN